MNERQSDVAAAAGSLKRVLKGVPGMKVESGVANIVVTTNDDCRPEDRAKLRALIDLDGWERWPVMIAGAK